MSSRPPLLDGQTPLKNLKAFCQCTLTYSILLTNNLGWVVPNITYIQNSPHRFLFRNRNLRCTCETSPILPPFCLTLISPLTSKTSWKPKVRTVDSRKLNQKKLSHAHPVRTASPWRIAARNIFIQKTSH